MSYCEINKHQTDSETENNNAIKIFYKTYGNGPTKVLLIIGLAGTHESWGPQIKTLTEGENNNTEVCSFDNRGMGRSSVPTKKSDYTTSIMARDAIALMDHLGWSKAHVIGHSMGAMISSKLAAMAPHRVSSLALLNVTGGGFQCFPKIDRKMIALAIRFLKAKTPEQRAAVDLDTHYTKEYLDEYVGVQTRRTILYQEYVKGISSSGMQSNFGFEGQISACWTHKLTSKEIQVIRSAGFLISVIHGRHDIIAQMIHARKLAENLQPFAKMVDLHGAHLVSHERPEEVNEALLGLIEASKQNISPHEWSNLSEIDVEILSGGNGGKEENRLTFFLKKVHLFILYMFGVFVMAFEKGRKMLMRQKPVRVSATAS